MERTLQMVFTNESGRSQTISIADTREDLTEGQVEAAMALLITKNIFSGSGGELVAPVEARVVGRTVEVLYSA